MSCDFWVDLKSTVEVCGGGSGNSGEEDAGGGGGGTRAQWNC